MTMLEFLPRRPGHYLRLALKPDSVEYTVEWTLGGKVIGTGPTLKVTEEMEDQMIVPRLRIERLNASS